MLDFSNSIFILDFIQMAMNAGEIIAPMLAQYQREHAPMLAQYQREQGEKEREKFNNLRQLEIGQEVKKYKTPAAKRAVSFLLESKNDWNDCFDEFKSLVGTVCQVKVFGGS